MANSFKFVVIDTCEDEDLAPMIDGAPQYERQLARTVVRVIRAIHGLPRFFRGEDLSGFEVYLGRAGATPGHVLARLGVHRRDRGHKYGAVLFRCPTERVLDMEHLGIALLQGLKSRGQLCVANANVAKSGAGGFPETKESVVYLTWKRRCEPTEFVKPLTPDITEVAAMVAPHFGIKASSLRNALMGLKRPTTELSFPELGAI